jgi:hydroxyacylglutathione hydrolase
VIDSRPAKEYAAGHLLGTVHIPSNSNSFSTYAGWLVDYSKPVVLIAAESQVDRLVNELRAIGVDNIVGVVSAELAKGPLTTPQATASELSENPNELYIIDVRGQTEYDESHLAISHHIPLGYLTKNLDALPRDKQIVVHCQTGVRSQIAASLLQKHGFENVVNLVGGLEAWRKAGLPIERPLLEFAKA